MGRPRFQFQQRLQFNRDRRRRRPEAITFVVLASIVLLNTAAQAATVAPGFTIEVFSQGTPITSIQDAAFGPGGAFGSDLFIVSNEEDRLLTMAGERLLGLPR